jgi:hypothetical protein
VDWFERSEFPSASEFPTELPTHTAEPQTSNRPCLSQPVKAVKKVAFL